MKRIIILLTVASLSLPIRFAAQDPAALPFGDGEELTYTVSYRAALIPNMNVMHVTLRTVNAEMGGRPHYHVIGNGRTSGFVKGFFNLDDTYHAWLDAETSLPSRMTSDLREDNYRFSATYNYDWTAMTVSTTSHNAKQDSSRYATMPLKHNSGDALSLFYRMRRADPDKLVPGQKYPLDLVLDGVTRPICYRFVGREEIKVRKLGTFRALKFTCTMATGDGSAYEEGMELTVWISDDINRVPLCIESPVRVGSVRVTLADARTMHPRTSMIK